MAETSQMPDGQGARGARFPAWLFNGLLATFNSIGTAWIFVLMLLINADVFSRFLANQPIRGVPEIVGLSIVAIVFIQMGHTLRVGRFTRSDSLLAKLAEKRPGAAHGLLAFHDLAGIAVMAIILFSSWPQFLEAVELQEYVGAEGYFTAPVWPVKLIIVMGSVLCIVQYFIMLCSDLRSLASPVPFTMHHESEI